MGKKVFNLSFYLLIFAVAYYVLVFSLESVLTHMIIGDNVHDVGVYDQPIWLLSRLMVPYSTCSGHNLFGFHISFYCVLLAPLFWLWNDIRALYIIQTLLLGLAVFPIYFYAKEKLGSSYLALIIGIAFLLYPILGNMNLDNFHPEVAIVFFFSLAIYYLLLNNFRLFYAFFAFSLIGKEDMAVIFVFVGLYILLFKKKLKPALLVILISIGYYLLCNKIIMPIANGMIPFDSSGPVFYSQWFGLYAENIFNPRYYLASIYRPEAWQYYRRILEPVGYLPLLCPSILLMALPQVLVNVLSNIGYLISINYHYDYVVVVIVFFALIQGLSALNRLMPLGKNIAFVIVGLILLVLAFIYNSQWSRLPFWAHWPSIINKVSQAQSASVKASLEGLKLIPENASVSASGRLFPQLSHRREIYFFPNPFQEAYRKPGEWLPSAKEHLDYVAVLWWNLDEEEKRIFNYLQKSSFFETIYRKGDIIILKNNKKSLPSNFGVKYELYDSNTHLSFPGKPANQSQLKQAGVVSMLYFPESDYYFANLLGEKLPVGGKFTVDFSGYLFIPKENNYSFVLQGQGEAFLEIDGNNVNEPIELKPGFHPFRMKYLSAGRRFGLKFRIKPEGEKEYIPSDRDFVLKASNLDQIVKERLQEIREREKLIRSLPNLVVNGGFELVGANRPLKWKLGTWRSDDALCSYGVDTRVKRSGQKSARLEHGGRGTGVSYWGQTIQVKPDTRYKLAGWIKTENVTPKGAGAWIFLGGVSVGTKRVYGTSDWQYYEIEVRTGMEQDKVEVLCRLGDYGWDNQGVAFFDDIVFRELPDEE